MNKKNVFMVCGVPGSGKSTWVEEKASFYGDKAAHISRDKIRFALLKDGDDYFSKEQKVFKEFIKQINKAIKSDDKTVIFIDATHLNEKSRYKVLDKLDLSNTILHTANFICSLDFCLANNEKRDKNSRSYVDPKVIKEMYKAYQPATKLEKYEYHVLSLYPEGVYR